MAWLSRLSLRIGLGAMVLALSALSTQGFAQIFPVCSWPFESTGQGITNVATPDTHAAYWVMPFDSVRWRAMLIQGQYPRARFFNFNSYTDTGATVDSIVDSNIAPDPGSTNPFATPAAAPPENYTVTVSAGITGAANLLHAAGSRLVFVVYRVYLPDQGLDRTGGADVPAVTLLGRNGNVRRLRPCPFADAETSLGNLIISLSVNGFSTAGGFLQRILTAANQHPPLGVVACNPGQSRPRHIPFAPATLGANFFANPETRYLEADGVCLPQGSVVVVRGRAPVFPNTYAGGSVFQPAFDGAIQLRYWSFCNNAGVVPYPVIVCNADFQTVIGPDQFYTYVLSNDQAPPPWLPPEATWLPWGPVIVPKNLILRNINEGAPILAGDYIPIGAVCNEALFAQQGWQACFASAGVP